jgi:hypothetical protein
VTHSFIYTRRRCLLTLQHKEKMMPTTRFSLAIAVAVAAYAAIAYAQQFPMLDQVANKVVQKYQSASCEQLWEKK